jgi:hypothetical protein
VLAALPLACAPRVTGTPPVETNSKPVAPPPLQLASGCEAAERAVEGWIAAGRYGRALVVLSTQAVASCPGRLRLSNALDGKRRELGLSAALPSSELRLGLSRVRRLRAEGRLDQARASLQGLLASSAGQAFVLAEAGLGELAGGNAEAASGYFERAMLAFGAPELEPAGQRYGDFAHVAFGPDAELWSCNSRLRVTDGNTLEPLFRIPLVDGCTGLDVSDRGEPVTTRGWIARSSLTEAPSRHRLRAVRFAGQALLELSEQTGADGVTFAERGPSGKLLGRSFSLPEAGGELSVSRDPEGTWTVVSTTNAAWAFDPATSRAPLTFGGPAVAVRGKRAVVNARDHADLVELPSKRRVRRVPIRDCPKPIPPSADVSWAEISRDASTVALSRCSSITTWRWDGESPKPLGTAPDELRSSNGELEPFALSDDGSLLARASTHSLEVFETRTGNKLRGLERAAEHTLTVAAAPSGALALTTGERRTFVVSEGGNLEGELAVPSSCRPSWYGSDALLLQCGQELQRVARAGGRTLSKTRLEAAPAAVFAVPPEHVVVAREQRSQLVHLEGGKVERELAGRVSWVSPDGKLAVTSETASDGASSIGVVSLATGFALASARDKYVRAELDPVTGALLVLGSELWYFAPPAFRATRLAERPALKPPPGTWPTALRFSADSRRAVVGFGDGGARSWELATAREPSGPVDAVPGLVWSGNRGYRRSDGKHVVTIEAAPSGTAFSVTAVWGVIDFLGTEPAALPVCSFGVIQFPFALCRNAVLVSGLLPQLSTRGEWYGG